MHETYTVSERWLPAFKLLLVAASCAFPLIVLLAELFDRGARKLEPEPAGQPGPPSSLASAGRWLWILLVPGLLAICASLYSAGWFSTPLFASILLLLFLQEKASLRAVAVFLCASLPLLAAVLSEWSLTPDLLRGGAILGAIALSSYVMVESRLQTVSGAVWQHLLHRIRRPAILPGEKTRARLGPSDPLPRTRETPNRLLQAEQARMKGLYHRIP